MNEKENPNDLTRSQQFDNLMFAGAMVIVSIAAIQWILTTWWRQWRYCQRKRKPFRPQLPRKITCAVTSGVPASMFQLLKQWGISCQVWGAQWVDRYTLECSVLVAAQQFDYADAILYQNGDTIVSQPGNKRGAQFSRPWGVSASARSFDEGIYNLIGSLTGDKYLGLKGGHRMHKRAKLGKTYYN